MTLISTYIETPFQQPLLANHSFDSLIVDLPFCSVRPHIPYDWSNEELENLTQLKFQHLVLNCDGLYSDAELAIIKLTIRDRNLDKLFTAFRVQDPGLIQWIKDQFPQLKVQCNPETGIQNQFAIRQLFDMGVSLISINHEIPFQQLQRISNTFPEQNKEVLVQGPILIQYSRRRFLTDFYDKDSNETLRFTAEDQELPLRKFTFLNTIFGHFMFAQFQRCLGRHINQLQTLPRVSWLIDARGESIQYFSTALALYSNSSDHSSETVETYIKTLHSESKKPQKPGFFISNNTDYDWRNLEKRPTSIGQVLSVKKDDAIIIQFSIPVNIDDTIDCYNPDRSIIALPLTGLKNIDDQYVTDIHAFTLYLLAPIKGIQVKGQLYFKNS